MHLLLLLILALPTHAAKSSYPVQKLGAKGVSEIRVVGVKGRLHLQARPTKYFAIRVKHTKGSRSEDWHLSVDRQGSALVLEVFNTALGPEWRKVVRKDQWPEFDVDIQGPSRPTTVSWREGAIDIRGWSKDVEASFLSGPLTAKGMKAALKVQAVESDVRVEAHRGALELKGEKGRVDLKDVEGEAVVRWLNGNLSFDNIRGKMTLECADSNVGGSDLEGDWGVKVPSGKVELKAFRGNLKAEGESASWNVTAGAPSDLEVISVSGPVRVTWLKGGFKFFLSSATGEIKVPKPYEIVEREGKRVAEASNDERPRGMIFVRTDSGAIDLTGAPTSVKFGHHGKENR